MSNGRELLEVQALDLASDGLHERRRTMQERAALDASQAEASALDGAHASLEETRETLRVSERDFGGQVADIAAKAKEVEGNLYSGSVTAAKELEALQEEVRLHRVRQTELEEQEMGVLEEIDRVEGKMRDNRSARAAADQEAARLREAIARAEGEIDGELAELAERCAGRRQGLPEGILAEYDRLRGKERLGGRAAAELTEGTCGACRVRLPVVDYNRIKNESADVLACCPRCLRVLVR